MHHTDQELRAKQPRGKLESLDSRRYFSVWVEIHKFQFINQVFQPNFYLLYTPKSVIYRRDSQLGFYSNAIAVKLQAASRKHALFYLCPNIFACFSHNRDS